MALRSLRSANPGVLRPTEVRTANASAVLRLLFAAGPLSRGEVAARLGLTHAPVTRITAKLAEDGWVEELSPVDGGGPGRPRVPVALRADSRHAVGVHIGALYVNAGVVDLTGHSRSHVELAHDGTVDGVVEVVADACDRLEAPQGSHELGIGVITGGWVDASAGVVRRQRLFDWRQDVPLRALLTDRLGRDVVLESTPRAQAGADVLHGVTDGVTDFVHAFVGNVIELGVVVDGRVRSADAGWAGDLSNWVLELEDGRASTAAEVLTDSAVAVQARAHGVPVPTPTVEAVVDATSDPVHGEVARTLLDQRARRLGQLLAGVNSLLAPQLIVISCPPGALGNGLEVVAEGLRARSGSLPVPPLRRGTTRDNPQVAGAAAVVLATAMDSAMVVIGS